VRNEIGAFAPAARRNDDWREIAITLIDLESAGLRLSQMAEGAWPLTLIALGTNVSPPGVQTRCRAGIQRSPGRRDRRIAFGVKNRLYPVKRYLMLGAGSLGDGISFCP